MSKRKHHTPEEIKAAKRAWQRKYYLANKAEIYRKSQVYSKANAERRRAWRRARYKANPEKFRKYARDDYKKNTDKRKSEHKRWMKKNPSIVNFHTSKRRARERLHPMASGKEIKKLYSEASDLFKNTGIKHEVDHIIPFKSGGFHHEKNMQAMPRVINGSSGKYQNPFWLAPSPAYKDWRDVPRFLWPVDLVPKYLELLEKNKGSSIRWDTAA